jgi:hypothetical protein
MDESNADRISEALDLFVLSRLCDRPLSEPEVQSGLQPAFKFLALVGTRTPKQSFELVRATLERLQREGWLRTEPRYERSGERAGAEIVYALTAAGEQRVKAETARQRSVVARFVEDDDMDKSFGRFLSAKGLPYAT